jgi:hypothetical protein
MTNKDKRYKRVRFASKGGLHRTAMWATQAGSDLPRTLPDLPGASQARYATT